MSTWGQNPYQPYTQPAHQWEQEQRRRQALEDQRYRDRLAMTAPPAPMPGPPALPRARAGAPTLPVPPSTGAPSGTSSHRPRASGPGPIDRLSAWLADGSIWFVDHLWPLRATKNACLGLAQTGKSWKLNAVFAAIGALLLPAAVGAGSGSLFLLGAGALAGWFAVRTVAIVGALLTGLIGLAIMLGLIAGVIWGVTQLL